MMRLSPRSHPLRSVSDGALAIGRGLTAGEVAELKLPDEAAKQLRDLSERAAEIKAGGAHGEARRLLGQGVDAIYMDLPEEQQDEAYFDPPSAPFDADELADRIRRP